MSRILICAAIGAVATCLVAWGIAAFVPSPQGLSSRPSGIGDGWSYWVGRNFGTVSIARVRAYFTMQEPLLKDYRAVRDRDVPAWSAVHRVPVEGIVSSITYTEEARGWPLLALGAETAISRSIVGAQPAAMSGALVLRLQSLNGRAFTILPLRPIWSGFIINTAFFGAIAFALAFCSRMVRRAHRQCRGRCKHCGYDLRGSSLSGACPECGRGEQE